MWFSSPAWDSLVYWALDLEMGGLDPRTDAILAVGMVPIRAGTIRVPESYYTLVRPEPDARVDPRSVTAHQLVERDLRDAPALAEVVPEVARRLAQGVLVVHNRELDEAFLRRAFARSGARWPAPRIVDTVDLVLGLHHRRRARDPYLPERPPALGLRAVRREIGLPDYPAHDALSDALATAELFLALRHALGARRLRDLR